MWKLQKAAKDGRITLSISGRIEACELIELQKALSSEEAGCQEVALDLKDVKLVDDQVVAFLACCEASGTRLRNCAAYIREWVTRKLQNDARLE